MAKDQTARDKVISIITKLEKERFEFKYINYDKDKLKEISNKLKVQTNLLRNLDKLGVN